MKWNLDELERKLNKISDGLNETDEKIHKIDKNIRDNEIKTHYQEMNEQYKKWISQYSKGYIEMSEWYYGENLPYDVYCKEFKIVNDNSTYLDSSKDVRELYALFIFFSLFHFNLSNTLSS